MIQRNLESDMLTVNECAALLGIRPGTVRLWLSQRRLPHAKLGRSIRIPRKAVEEFIASHMVPAKELR